MEWLAANPSTLGQGLTGKTLGLVGFGLIAQATGQRASALGMNVAYHSRRPALGTGARYVNSLAALTAEADVLSLHVPGGAEAHHLIDGPLLASMKPTALLVNTARGSVVDEAALARALRLGHIAAAGLDVFEEEPYVHPALLVCENAVLRPHLGSATAEAHTAMWTQSMRAVEAFFAAREPPNRVA